MVSLLFTMYILGYAPVLNADVAADVDKPDWTTESITLLDNGAGNLTTCFMKDRLILLKFLLHYASFI